MVSRGGQAIRFRRRMYARWGAMNRRAGDAVRAGDEVIDVAIAATMPT